MPHLSKPQAWVLAAFSLGMALARRCSVGAVAEELWCLGKPDTVERRLQRFLSNPRVQWQAGCEALAQWVVGRLAPGSLIVLLVDESSLKEHLKVMAVSLAYRGRAIPLAWWCYRQEHWPLGQVELISSLLHWVAKAIPAGCPVLVQADRGIGTSPQLLRAIESMGWYFLVRVQGQVRLIMPQGHQVPFSTLVWAVGQKWSGWVYAFKKAGWLRCWAVGLWELNYEQPWLLLTNWPQAQGNWYAMRMWEELAFRDFKSSGWQWQRSRVWDPQHANRLWLVMALAYVWMITLGTRVMENKQWRAELVRGTKKRLSVFQLGLRFVKRWIELGRHLFFDLLLIPSPPLDLKSVVH